MKGLSKAKIVISCSEENCIFVIDGVLLQPFRKKYEVDIDIDCNIGPFDAYRGILERKHIIDLYVALFGIQERFDNQQITVTRRELLSFKFEILPTMGDSKKILQVILKDINSKLMK